MILVDTSIIVAWLDPSHQHHDKCSAALDQAAEDLAVSNITYGELAAGGRTRESVDEDLTDFTRLLLDRGKPVLPDFFIRAQAAVYGLPLLTNDGRRRTAFPEVDFLLV